MRDFIRPGLLAPFKKEMLGKREILINPTFDEVVQTLTKVQKNCRKNKLTNDDVRTVWDSFHIEINENPYIGVLHVSSKYGFDMEGSFIQIVEICDDLLGVLVSREMTPPGMDTILPISVSIEDKPRKWINEIVTAFWTHLTDDEIEKVYQRGLLQTMANEGREVANSEHQIKRRELQMQSLCRGNRPEFISELKNALLEIVSQMTDKDLVKIAWRDFQKKWPSLSKRYHREFLGLIR